MGGRGTTLAEEHVAREAKKLTNISDKLRRKGVQGIIMDRHIAKNKLVKKLNGEISFTHCVNLRRT